MNSVAMLDLVEGKGLNLLMEFQKLHFQVVPFVLPTENAPVRLTSAEQPGRASGLSLSLRAGPAGCDMAPGS